MFNPEALRFPTVRARCRATSNFALFGRDPSMKKPRNLRGFLFYFNALQGVSQPIR
jgi:hypothetical protein